jgi:hypothetical protein
MLPGDQHDGGACHTRDLYRLRLLKRTSFSAHQQIGRIERLDWYFLLDLLDYGAVTALLPLPLPSYDHSQLRVTCDTRG